MGKIDATLFIRRSKGIFLRDAIICQIYVDAIIFGSPNINLCKDFAKIMAKKFEMSIMGELKFFPGFQINQFNEGLSSQVHRRYSQEIRNVK